MCLKCVVLLECLHGQGSLQHAVWFEMPSPLLQRSSSSAYPFRFEGALGGQAKWTCLMLLGVITFQERCYSLSG